MSHLSGAGLPHTCWAPVHPVQLPAFHGILRPRALFSEGSGRPEWQDPVVPTLECDTVNAMTSDDKVAASAATCHALSCVLRHGAN